jgi:hypothetical protein
LPLDPQASLVVAGDASLVLGGIVTQRAHPADPRATLIDHVAAALETRFADDRAAVRWLLQRYGGDLADWAAAGFGAARREREDRLHAVRRLQREIADAEEREA